MDHAQRAPAHVLLVEDNRGDVYLVKEALREHAVDVRLSVLTRGDEAMRYFGSSADEPAPALVLLDLNLPQHPGTDILARIRSNPDYAETPVVILTSSDSPRDRLETARLGADGYFRKPLDLVAFMEIGALVKGILRHRAANGHAAAGSSS